MRGTKRDKTETPLSILATALETHHAGVQVIPIAADGTKRPTLQSWTTHQTTTEDIHTWFDGPHPHQALGAVCGPPSGNLEMIEIEGPHKHLISELAELARNSGLENLWNRITNGWLEQSPSGGWHWLYRVNGDPITGNTKLAKAEDGSVIAETRGTGGQVVIAPSAGAAHASGKPWQKLIGGPDSIPILTEDERNALHTLFRTLNQAPEPAKNTTPQESARDYHDGSSPGDDFEKKTPWADILTGWTPVFQRGTTTYWRRPGKNIGISATTGHADDRDRLYVFTTSTELPAETPLTKFGAHGILTHGGDYTAAAKALKEHGYGKQAEKINVININPNQTPSADQRTGTDDTVISIAPKQARKAAQQATSGQLAFTDDGYSLAFAEAFSSQLRYHEESKRWMAWTGQVWERQAETGGITREYAKQLAREVFDSETPDKEELRFKKRALSDAGVTAMLNMARTIPALVVRTKDLDAHPWELNTPTGIINLHNGTTTPHDPQKLHTKITTAGPADTPEDNGLWHRFLTSAVPDKDTRDFLQKVAGYSAIGEVIDHIMPFIHGPGGRGKGTFTETLKAALGSYAAKAPSGFLMQRHNPEHSTEIAKLDGARFVLASEVNERDRFDEQKVKEITGGDTLTARFMHRDYFDFTPSHTLWLMGNNKPNVETGGDAFWRRLRLIPFTQEVTAEAKITDLQNQLIADHLPQVVAWIVAGAVKYKHTGLSEVPEAVQAEVDDYASETDIIGQFLEECCIIGGGEDTTATVKAIRDVYERWCDEQGHYALAARRLSAKLEEHGVLVGRKMPKGTGGIRLYGNIRIRPEVEAQGGMNTW